MSAMERGWKIIPLLSESRLIISDAVQDLSARLEEWGYGSDLEAYECEDDVQHLKIQVDLAKRFTEKGYGRKIIERSLHLFQSLLGLDLHIQKYPYLRIARPGRPQDNIGIHRDTKYGGTPYECSCVIPLTSMPLAGSLHVLDGSHIQAEEAFPDVEIDTDVVKGSDKHKLGFVYRKKKLAAGLDTHPVEVKVGEILMFPLSLVHGQEINQSTISRFSVDIRLTNSLAPIAWTHNVHKDYWEELCSSPVTEQAKLYYANQVRA